MTSPTPFDAVAHVPPEAAYGMLREAGEQTDAARPTGQATWQYRLDLLHAVDRALDRLAQGERPAKPSPSPPTWLTPLIRERIETLAQVSAWSPEFLSVRSLERLGAIRLDPDREYVLAFVSAMGDKWTEAEDVAACLRSDPELLQRAFWPMFRVEGGGEVSLANIDKFANRLWRSTVAHLVEDGTIDRDQVVTACLDALCSDLGAFQAGWFTGTLAHIAPEPEWFARHQGRLLAVLRSSVSASVSFATDRLRTLDKAGLLDDDALPGGLAAGLETRSKTTAITLLRLLGAVASRRPDLVSAVAASALRAVAHPAADVQAGALDLLERLGMLELARGTDVHPTLTGRVGDPTPAGLVPVTPTWSPPMMTLPPKVGADDLVERTAALLEDATDPLEVESVLTALAALDEPAVLSPLTTRARVVARRGLDEWAIRPLTSAVAALVLTSQGIEPPLPPEDAPVPTRSAGLRFLQRRLAEVESSLTGLTRPAPLLATPSAGPWVEPQVLVDRLRRLPDAPTRMTDVTAALLRLHPEGREEALATWGSAPRHPLTPVLTYALGAPAPQWPEPFGASVEDADLWVAAARARSPLDEDHRLAAAGLLGAGRASPITAGVTWRREPTSDRQWLFGVDVVEGVAPFLPGQPTAARAQRPGPFGFDPLAEWPTWMATTYPHDAEQFLVECIGVVLTATQATPARMPHVGHVLDALMSHPGRTGRLSAAAIAAGLAAVQQSDRVRASDCFAALVTTGRIPLDVFVEALVDASPAVPLGRWAQAWGDAAESAPRARDVVIEVLIRVLPRLEPARKDLFPLLERLAEEIARTGKPPVEDPAFAAWATRLSGSSRSGRMARQLVAGRR